MPVLNTPLTRRGLLKMGAATLASGLIVPTRGLAAQGTRDTDTVRLGYGRGGIPLVARERGELEKRLKERDIKVEWIGPFANHAPSLQAVVGGSADFGFWGSTTPALAAILAGSPLVFTSFNVYSPRSTAIIVKTDSGINHVRDLAGKRVAVNRAGLGEFLVVAALEKFNVPREKVQFVYLNPPDAGPAFAQGKVDAWSMWSPGVDISREQNGAKDIFFEGTDLDFLIDYSSLVVTRDFATRNAALVRAVQDAYYIEGQWISEHPVEAEIIAQREGKYNDAVRDKLVSYARKNKFYEPDDDDFITEFQRAADWLASHGIIKSNIKVADHSIKV
ncbi:ABC transporter substrate-binding protein [Bordetella muralis]|uniref:ABC transporter substrate-binding protein n=1 Tax=Bordetella muralis TaxID=1649130 RepID=UPI0039EF5BED